MAVVMPSLGGPTAAAGGPFHVTAPAYTAWAEEGEKLG